MFLFYLANTNHIDLCALLSIDGDLITWSDNVAKQIIVLRSLPCPAWRSFLLQATMKEETLEIQLKSVDQRLQEVLRLRRCEDDVITVSHYAYFCTDAPGERTHILLIRIYSGEITIPSVCVLLSFFSITLTHLLGDCSFFTSEECCHLINMIQLWQSNPAPGCNQDLSGNTDWWLCYQIHEFFNVIR